MRGLSLVAASGGHSSSRFAGLSLSRPLLLQSTGSRRAGSVVVAHGPGCSAACGILPDQGLNPCPLHWQADPQPLRHQGSPLCYFLIVGSVPLIYNIYVVAAKPRSRVAVLSGLPRRTWAGAITWLISNLLQRSCAHQRRSKSFITGKCESTQVKQGSVSL